MEAAFADVIHSGVLKNFAIVKGEHLCWSVFFISCRPQNGKTMYKRLQQRFFPLNIVKF